MSDQERYLESINNFKKATEIDPNFSYAFNNWGGTLNKLERYEEACEKLQRATELEPELAGAYMNWGDALRLLGKHDDAIDKYRKAMELDIRYRMGAYAPTRYYEVLRDF